MIKVFRLKIRYIILAAIFLFALTSAFNKVMNLLENRKVAVLSWTVANKVIVIDPGHGGIDPGSKGANGAIEKEITLDMSKKLAAVLSQAGAIVIMTRESDTDLSDPGGGPLITRKRQDLSRRVGMANDRGADAFISIHVNSFKSGIREHGAQTFYQPNSMEGAKLAKCIQGELVRLMKNTNRQAKAVDYYTTRNAKMPSAIVEIGFISNPKEEELMCEQGYQGKLAYAIYSGIVKYFAELATPTDGNIDKDKAIQTFMINKGEVCDAP
ncbi:N-acetylmuramoyl-L-alanine amidase CwlD [Desulfotruncus alcoholivorax]|uniref:N-acetylmuramoyl-L-alanine amidase CwlD n=1 Tax=Desulfotruncus alcoholivorax TaxID=265477 RepID=UPI000409CBBD|nr:N-acetylmuramoyl-L-alanine amidase CwlD [Desulfotruncus alcoholivorax]